MPVRIVGWMNDEEWIEVYKKIFYGSSLDKRKAIDVIAVWQKRFAGKIPVAIAATCRLMEALVEVENLHGEGARRQMLASAVMQFVGLLTEQKMNTNFPNKPMRLLGEHLGIPEWVINLRHDMAHGPLPSLIMLEKAVCCAVDWLKFNHWEIHAEKMFKSVCQNAQVIGDVKIDAITRQKMIQLISEFIDSSQTKKKQTKILEKLNIMANDDDAILEYLCLIFVYQDVLVVNSQIEQISDDFKLSHSSLLLWSPVLKFMNDRSYLSNLFFHIVHKLCLSNQLNTCEQSQILTCWGCQIVNWFDEDAFRHIINKCAKLLILNVNPFTTKLFESFKLNQYLGEEKFDNLVSLRNIFNPSASDANKVNSTAKVSKIYSIDDVKDRNKVDSPGLSPQDGATWSLYDGNVLEDCKIGIMPGQNITDLSAQLLGFTHKPEVEMEIPQPPYNNKIDTVEQQPEVEIHLSPVEKTQAVSMEAEEITSYINTLDCFLSKDWETINERLDIF